MRTDSFYHICQENGGDAKNQFMSQESAQPYSVSYSYLERRLERLVLSPVLGLLEHQRYRPRHPQVVVHLFIGQN